MSCITWELLKHRLKPRDPHEGEKETPWPWIRPYPQLPHHRPPTWAKSSLFQAKRFPIFLVKQKGSGNSRMWDGWEVRPQLFLLLPFREEGHETQRCYSIYKKTEKERRQLKFFASLYLNLDFLIFSNGWGGERLFDIIIIIWTASWISFWCKEQFRKVESHVCSLLVINISREWTRNIFLSWMPLEILVYLHLTHFFSVGTVIFLS